MIEINTGQYQFENFKLQIDLNIQQGEFCAVLGPSGAGKSTLLSLIAGFETLSKGQIILDGAAAAPDPAQRPVSMIFQDHNVFAHLTVLANVALGISPSLKLTEQQMAKVDDALKHVGLEKLKSRKPGELSGGERQRIALARVLVRNRPILLLDEPFAALDPGLRSAMLQLVSDIQKSKNLTVLLVTHQPEDAKKVAQKIIFVKDGTANGAIEVAKFFNSNEEDVLKYLGTSTLPQNFA
jgi:thiamine transport system ATP-binding protein